MYVMSGEEETESPATLLAKFAYDGSGLALKWVLTSAERRPRDLEIHLKYPVVAGSMAGNGGDFWIMKVSPEGELRYNFRWGGDGEDELIGLLAFQKYLVTMGKSDSYTVPEKTRGMVWALTTEKKLEVILPDSGLKWLVFYEGLILPVGGGEGSGSALLPEADYYVSVSGELEKDWEKLVFEKWSDGVEDNPRKVSLFEDTSLEALYAKYYWIEVESGYGTAAGSGYYKDGSIATISVSPTEVQVGGGKVAVFKGWERNGEFISTKQTLKVSVTGPATYTAVWAIEEEAPEEEKFTVEAYSPYGAVSGAGTYGKGETAPSRSRQRPWITATALGTSLGDGCWMGRWSRRSPSTPSRYPGPTARGSTCLYRSRPPRSR